MYSFVKHAGNLAVSGWGGVSVSAAWPLNGKPISSSTGKRNWIFTFASLFLTRMSKCLHKTINSNYYEYLSPAPNAAS